MAEVVLITGVSRFLGSRLAAQLSSDPSIGRVIGIDTVPPREVDRPLLGRTEFVRADIRNPLVAKVMAQARVSVVVHAALHTSPRAAGGRVAMQEMNVIGTMQLLAACQKSDDVHRLVVRSTAGIYGCTSRDAAVFTEDMGPDTSVDDGYAKDAVEIEAYVRGFARRRPDVDVSVLRQTRIVGPTVKTALTRYLAGPLVPTSLGFDPRVQLLHEADAVESLRLATVTSRPGVVNVAADGVLALSQVIRRAGRIRVPVTRVSSMAALLNNDGAAELVAEERRWLRFGRAVDTTALHTRFGYQPRYTTGTAIDSFAAGQRPLPHVARTGLRVGSDALRARRARQLATPGA
ncbi:NAD-dependent epimerase/dehydratase family protein [uncultured Jatrophihabitans sp.]|uniref:NAD-dependent epimerase/dehydratase family protein n=1 Tax=uncultured Jatrophihabitans sp. TaxID=1610747 RepID=UPI0035CB71D5